MKPPRRFAAIDIGTNSLLLLVAERDASGRFTAVEEALEMVRLGEGVDQSGRIGERAMREAVDAARNFADRARSLGAEEIAMVATSAARDAKNGEELLAGLRRATGVEAEILSGQEEAELSYRSVAMDFGEGPLWALDIGGGSTELILGERGKVRLSRSFDLGAVRLTERYISADPPSAEELGCIEKEATKAFAQLGVPEPGATLVGIAGTVTTLAAIHLGLDAYDGSLVHGQRMGLDEVRRLEARLAAIPLAERLRIPGLPAKRADVIVAGALILRVAMERLGFSEVVVSDRGVRWGLLNARFGG